jgi:PilZ domain
LPFTERRRATRFELQLPVIVRWMDGSEMREARTTSEDISSNGIFFRIANAIKDGTTVEVEMTLPSKITLAGPVRVRCLGRVQHCDLKEGAPAGVGAGTK